jgi:ABC-type ATPase involved in cell division
MTPTQSTVLEIDAVSLFPKDSHHAVLQDVTLRLETGKCALVTVEHVHSCALIGDLVQGLLEPDIGQVRFLGQPWAALDRSTQASHRGRMGRVFSSTAWISNLDVDENIVLAEQHHQAFSEASLQQRVHALAHFLGLADITQRRPNQLSAHELKLAQWIRAILSQKHLLILENPTLDVYPSAIPALLEALAETRRQGTAVLWISNDFTEYERQQIDPDVLYRIHEGWLEP